MGVHQRDAHLTAPGLLSEPLIASGALIELFPNWPGETFPLYIMRPSRRLAPAAVEAFSEFCREICAT
jgi:DNA-binding transcriptional LysR family regulator